MGVKIKMNKKIIMAIVVSVSLGIYLIPTIADDVDITATVPKISVTNETPTNGSTNIDIDLARLTIDINASTTFNWSIETSPDIGGNSANGASNGTKISVIAGLSYSTTYNWYVNVTAGENVANKTYNFTTKSKPAVSDGNGDDDEAADEGAVSEPGIPGFGAIGLILGIAIISIIKRKQRK